MWLLPLSALSSSYWTLVCWITAWSLTAGILTRLPPLCKTCLAWRHVSVEEFTREIQIPVLWQPDCWQHLNVGEMVVLRDSELTAITDWLIPPRIMLLLMTMVSRRVSPSEGSLSYGKCCVYRSRLLSLSIGCHATNYGVRSWSLDLLAILLIYLQPICRLDAAGVSGRTANHVHEAA